MLSPRTARRDDGGFSLIELLVVLLLLSIVGTIVMVTLKSGFRSTTFIQRETEASAELQRTVERISREFRVAHPFEAAVPAQNRAQLRVFRDGVCHRYFFRQEGTELVQYLQSPLLPAPPPPGSPTVDNVCTTAAPGSLGAAGLPRKVLLRGLTAGTTVFRYYDRNATQLVFPGAQPRDVAQVEITLRRNGGSGTPITVATRVDLRNKQEPSQ